MSETNSNRFHRYYNRIQSLLTTIPHNLRSIDISWIRLRRDGSISSASPLEDPSVTQCTRLGSSGASVVDSRPNPRRESTQSFSSTNSSSQTQSPAQSPTSGGQHLSRPPHSHLYRHSSHYPLLFGAYNNWSLGRDNRLINNFNNNNNNNNINNVEKDRNVLSAIMSIVVIATLATALAQPKWFSISGGVCARKYIGLQEFFYFGNFNSYHLSPNKVKSETVGNKEHEEGSLELTNRIAIDKSILYGMSGDLKNCVTPEIVTLQRTIIGLCFFAIMFNLIQFFFDTLGVHKKWLNAIRAHALGNILGVLLCVVIVGVSYLVSSLLEKEQRRLLKQKGTEGSHHIEVKFELSYYLVTFSGLLAIIAAASNLLRRPQHYYISASDAFWNDEIDDELTSSASILPNWHSYNTSHSSRSPHLSTPGPPPHPSVTLPPPPPYSP